MCVGLQLISNSITNSATYAYHVSPKYGKRNRAIGAIVREISSNKQEKVSKYDLFVYHFH